MVTSPPVDGSAGISSVAHSSVTRRPSSRSMARAGPGFTGGVDCRFSHAEGVGGPLDAPLMATSRNACQLWGLTRPHRRLNPLTRVEQ